MSNLVEILVVICYASILVELTFLHTPSVASSRRILLPDEAELEHYSDHYRRLFFLSPAKKLTYFILPLLVVYATFAYPVLELLLGPALFNDFVYLPTPAVGLLAACMMLGGRIITLASGFALRGISDPELEFLQTNRVFRWSRNPGLVGMYVMFAGFWIVMPSVLFLLGILVYITHMHFKVKIEEDYLANRYRASYARYRDRTPRYLV